MIFALALAVQWISIPSAAGLVLVDNAVVLANEVLLRDGSAPAAGDSLGELLGVADSRSRAERMAPAANTHEQSPDNSFVSYALEFSPSADSQGEWTQDGNINSDLLAASPDHVALQNAQWDSWTLAVAYTLTGEEQYKAQGAAILESTFSGAQALLPNMQYARLIPRTSIEDSRVNPLGFQEMNEIGLGLDAASLLSLSPAASAALDDWMWRYVEWLGGRLSAMVPSLKPIDQLWFHTQQAFVFKHLGTKVRLDAQCGQLRKLFPLLVGEDGSLASLPWAPTPEAAQLEALHGLVMAATACDGSGVDLWGLSSTDSPSGGYVRRAASTVISGTEGQRVELLPLSAGSAAARRASLSLALLYTETGREGASELMLRLLAANPDLQASRMPLVAALACVRADDVDGAGAARWGGFRVGALSCEDLDAASLPCEDVSSGFNWGGVGGIVVALVLALLPLAALGLLFWWLRRRRRPSHAHAHEIKSHETDNSMDRMSLDARLEDAKLSGGELEVTKVKVEPYEPDGYDPNNVEKILGDLTTGEQVIKAKELKNRMLGVEQSDLASGPSDMHGELGPVASAMSGGHSMMSTRDRAHAQGGHSSFVGGGASGTAFSLSPSHSLMGTPSMAGGGASSMAARTHSGMWQAERTSSSHAGRKHGHTPQKHPPSSRHSHSPHQGHHASGGSSQMSRHRRGDPRRGTGGSAPIGHHGDDRRPASSNRQRHRTHTLGAPMHPQQQQQQQQRHHHGRGSRSHPQRRRGTGKGGAAEGKALLELDQALNALQATVKPTKRSQRKVRPSDPRMASSSRSRGPSRRHGSRSQAQQPSFAEAHAKVLSAIDSRLRAAAKMLANAGKPKPKEKEKEGDNGAVSDVPVLENDKVVLPISAADGCVEGPRADRGDASEVSSSAGELSFTLPAAQGEPTETRQTLQLAGFQWLYTSDDSKSPEALRESIAVVQRQLKENPEMVAAAAVAAMDPSEPGAGAALEGGADVNGTPAADGDEEKKNAYAVVAALVATVRAEAAAEAERCQSEEYASSDDEQEAQEDSQLHGDHDGGGDCGSEDGSEDGVVSEAGSVMEFASAGGGDSTMFARADSMDTLNLQAPAVYSGDNLLGLHAGVLEEEDEGEGSGEADGSGSPRGETEEGGDRVPAVAPSST